jgi:chromosome segregation ATPase
MTEEVPEQLDRKDVKILYYKNTVSELQDQINDLQTDRTFLNDQLNNVTEQLRKATEQLQEYEDQQKANKRADVPKKPESTDDRYDPLS